MQFNSSNVLVQKISEANLKTYYIGFDLGVCQTSQFSEILMDTIVDFAFGYHTGILEQYDRRKLKEAAKAIYNIKEFNDVKWTYVDNNSVLDDDELKAEEKYLKRGEFGELILHLILRDYFNSIPLLSKIYFKDSDGVTVHGFDSVHIGQEIEDTTKTTLFLGESKIYYRKTGNAGEKGVKDLIEDIKSHFTKNFLERECTLISKKRYSYPQIQDYKDKNTYENFTEFISLKNYWMDTLENVANGVHKMQDFINSITVPVICTYQSDLFGKYQDDTHIDFPKEYESEMRRLQSILQSEISKIPNELGEPIRTNLNVVLVLLPIPSKKELIKLLHQKLYNQQNA